ncbi:ferredoxin like protein [Spinactinospora alkalitolerans]|uniref:Ferredoxin like protein n=1 Tax=Spinactinospora alkalitolerans TaxID=687207 RepID=A0A852U5P1_9ACTN|nr:4Fe-4S dicluster domain-containing protein [Spinactinospora alkalitolerans]NYE49230.1 ferredoxin like protein [Spinactinospora alkalitolerans]
MATMLERLRRRRRARSDGRRPGAPAAESRAAAEPPEWPEYAFAERMAAVEFRVADEPHIVVDTDVCRSCTTKACVTACPADLFVPTSDGGILFNYEHCFECGVCYLVCDGEGAITWSYPRGGHGVVMRWS